jgi:hypothetical protein
MENNIKTYYDLKYSNSSKIFESEEIKNLTPDQVQEAEKFYHMLVEKLQKGEEVNEGLLSGIVGAGIGLLSGSILSKTICKVLGISEDGVLGKLICSPVVQTAIGYAIGK